MLGSKGFRNGPWMSFANWHVPRYVEDWSLIASRGIGRHSRIMAFPYRRILTPVDFDDESCSALDAAAQIARQNDGVVLVFHVVPMIVPPAGMPVYIDVYRGQEDSARTRLSEIARKHLAGVKYELFTHIGDPAASILRAEKRLAADLIVIATHGRRGFSRVFLGSVAEMVLREATCPVLTIRHGKHADRRTVEPWMSKNPVTATLTDKLSGVAARMHEGGFRSVPVVEGDRVVGIITDRDLRRHTGYEEHTDVKTAMTESLISVTPETPIYEAALGRDHLDHRRARGAHHREGLVARPQNADASDP
jgi:universal stress protein A